MDRLIEVLLSLALCHRSLLRLHVVVEDASIVQNFEENSKDQDSLS